MKKLILLITLVAFGLAAPLTVMADNSRSTLERAWQEQQQQQKQLDAKFKAADRSAAQTESAVPSKTRQIGKYKYLCLNCPD